MPQSQEIRADYARGHNRRLGRRMRMALAAAALLYSLYLLAPDPAIRGVALWCLVGLGLASSLIQSWRDLA